MDREQQLIILKCGDCLCELDDLDSQSVDLILSDMPYGTTKAKHDVPIPLTELWPKLKRIAKSRAPILLFAQTPFDKVLGASNLKMLRYEWIWEKSAATGFLNAKKMPMKSHENILVFYQKLPKYYPQMTSGHAPVHSYTKHTADGQNYGKTKRVSGGGSTYRFPRSVLRFGSDKQTAGFHCQQKPVALLEYLIKTYTIPGDTVLDFCMGSGSTGVAAIKHNRSFIGIELCEEYFESAKKRIENTNGYNETEKKK